jgi:hypothetical protein
MLGMATFAVVRQCTQLLPIPKQQALSKLAEEFQMPANASYSHAAG